MTATLPPKVVEPTKPTAFRGWWILAVSVITVGLTGPGQTIGVSVFVDHIIEDLQLTRAAFASAYAIGTLLGSFALPFVGRLLDRYGVRRGQAVIGALFAVALINMSLVQNFAWLAIGFMFIRMLGQGSLSMCTTVAVSHWFDRKRGLAMGLLAVGGAALMALVPLVLNRSIETWGWRDTWLIAAVFIALSVIPLGLFGLVDRPDVIGQFPDGEPPVNGFAESGDGAPIWGLTLGQAIVQPMFWVVTAATTTAGMLVTALTFHQIDILEGVGLTKEEAAIMFLPQVLGGVTAGLVTGVLMDRLGGRYLPAIAMALLAFSLFLVTGLGSTSAIVFYAITIGITGGAVRASTTILIPGWFGTKHVGSLNGFVAFVGVTGSAAGPLLLTLTQESLGTYARAAVLLAAIPLAVGIAATFIKPPAPA